LFQILWLAAQAQATMALLAARGSTMRGPFVPLLARAVRHFATPATEDLLGVGAVASSAPLASASAASAAAAAAGATAPATTAGSALGQPIKRSRAADISYKGPIMEDLEGGARYADSIGKFYGNVPNHVRQSFVAPSNISQAPRNAAPLLMDGLASQAKSLAARTGFAPESWSLAPMNAYYGGNIALAPYSKGQTAAYHYPNVLVPRELAYRFPLDMYVDPAFQSSDPEHKFRMKGRTLFPMLQDHTTLLMIFSGQPLSGLFTGLRRWLDDVGDEFNALPKTQVLKMHCAKGWFSRKTHFLTKFQLRRQVPEDELFKTFVFRGRWKWEYEKALHMYDSELPSILLIDPLGYVRWHAVGLPTEEATELFRSLAHKLAKEKRKHA